MTNVNVSGQGPLPGSPGLVRPAELDPNQTRVDATQVKTLGDVNAADLQAYFTDTLASSGLKIDGKLLVNFLNNIPPPNAQTAGVSGTAAAGNPFLSPNPLVAFFITFNEVADVLRQTNNAQQELVLLEMALITDLAKGEAQQILTAAEAEATIFIAAAVSSFAEAGVALAQGAMQYAASKAADKQMEAKENDLDQNVETAKNNLTQAQTEFNTAQDKVKITQDNVTVERMKLSELEPGTDAAIQQKQTVEQMERTLIEQHTDVIQKQKNVYTMEENVRVAEKNQIDFKTKSLEQHQASVQAQTYRLQMAGQFLSKMIDGAANIVKAAATLEKGEAEATQKLLASFQQNANRMLDQLISARQENSRMIGDLMQQLRKFSDDAKKLGGSIAVQSSF